MLILVARTPRNLCATEDSDRNCKLMVKIGGGGGGVFVITINYISQSVQENISEGKCLN